ncbi:MAG: cobalamin-binding protein [Chloroflexota bacterium]|nr:cobalamin-binding protein [Chloroflexota bacterium]
MPRNLQFRTVFAITFGLMLLLATLPLMGACSSEQEIDPTLTAATEPEAEPELTTIPTLTPTPLRIVSLAPSNTEILFALGLADEIVGVAKSCNYPPEVLAKEKIGDYYTVDMEKVVALSPDLIIAANIHTGTIVPELERRGFDVLTVAPEKLDDLIGGIMKIGEETGKEEKALQLIEEMEARVNTVTNKVALLSEEDKPGVFYITFHDQLWTLGTGTITHEMIELAGGANIFTDLEGHGKTNLETVLDRNPEVILASTSHGDAADAPFEWALNEERLSETKARLNNQVFKVDSDLVTRPGPRFVDGLELIAELLYPDLFSE